MGSNFKGTNLLFLQVLTISSEILNLVGVLDSRPDSVSLAHWDSDQTAESRRKFEPRKSEMRRAMGRKSLEIHFPDFRVIMSCLSRLKCSVRRCSLV